MIAREEVLHVASLARLALAEQEIEPMARELSAVIEHIAHISELDLDGVEPTSHVASAGELAPAGGALRADQPTPCLPREIALAQAPAVAEHGFLVPSPQA